MKKSLLVFLSAPLGLIGAVMMLIILHAPFGFVSMLGVIALFGMIIRNSVILIDQIEQNREQGLSPAHALEQAVVSRFRPIILTAATAILAMIPLTTSVFWGPMAVAIMGGLILGTLVSDILFIPALYTWWFIKK
jgi:multidrug efflux pump